MLLLEQFENLTLHPKNAARLKELVLQLAVQGKLTENWRKHNPVVEPASELLKRIAAEKAQLLKEKKIKQEKPLEPIAQEEIPYSLPNNWIWCKLGIYLKTITDGSHFSPATQDFGFPYITVRDLDWSGNINFENCKKINLSAYQELVKSGCKPEINDVLFSKDGTVGKTAVVLEDRNFVVLSSLAILRPFDFSINPQFLKLLLTAPSILSQAIEKKTGSALKRIVLAKIKHLIIPIPPLAEQEALVARVEELMHKIEELEQQTKERIQLKKDLGTAALQQLTATADDNLELHWDFLKQQFQTLFDEEENVKKLRETILQLAVQGKLTSAWRKHNPNTEPASKLLKRIQAKKEQLVKEKKLKKEQELKYSVTLEIQGNFPNTWERAKAYEILFVTKLAGFEYTNHLNLQDTGEIPVIRAQNVRPLKLDITNLKYIDKKTSLLLNRCALTKPCLLMTFIGAGVGDVALFEKEERWHLAPNVAKMEPFEGCEEHINLKFLNYYLLSTTGKTEVFKQLKSTAQPSLSMGTIRDIDIFLPPIEEQHNLVLKLDELMQQCDELEKQIQQSKLEKETLMQGVVQEVFQNSEEIGI